MYTWGYIKDVILAKLDMTEIEAKNQNFLNRFIMFANECITQISGTIRPKQATYIFEVHTKDEWEDLYQKEYDKIVANWENENLSEDNENEEDEEPSNSLEQWLANNKIKIDKKIRHILKDDFIFGDIIKMPKDFIAFNGQSLVFEDECPTLADLCYGYIPDHTAVKLRRKVQVNPQNVEFLGENKLLPLKTGKYFIEYDARWFQFREDIKDDQELDMPLDVLECIPPYVASQCWKIDDLQRSAIFKNEFELAFSRINTSDYRNNEHFVPEGGW